MRQIHLFRCYEDLMSIIFSGHADATALLLAHGADPNRQDRKGRSPAHCGCAKGQFETIKLIGGKLNSTVFYQTYSRT